MSWMNELYQIYENYCGDTDSKEILLPVSHSTANAQIEVTLTETGILRRAKKIENKDDSVTIIPVTEDSGSRSSGIAPHPFADKLVYIAGDYKYYATGKRADNSKYYAEYMKQLAVWNDSEYTHPAVDAVYRYLQKGSLTADLIDWKVLELNSETGKLQDKIKILGILQEDAFVRFRIEYTELRESATWKDRTLYDCFSKFNAQAMGNKQRCYATGELLPATYKHPSKIRDAGDKAKLISTNDESGFTYRGRFDGKEQAISVSYDFSQKMHNALKWLIERQGVAIGSMQLIVWASALQPLPDMRFAAMGLENSDDDMDDIYDDDMGYDDEPEDEERTVPDTVVAYRKRLKASVWGYENKLEPNTKVMIMGLDAATTGRLAMVLYSELSASDFIHNVANWHDSIAWNRFNWKEKKNEWSSFSLYEIVRCAFGTEQEDKIKCKSELESDMICRLIPCVAEGRSVPKDIVNSLVIRASKPLAYSKYYNWRTVLETACGLLRKKIIEEKGECKMGLDYECTDRSYLYGRLIAVAEAAEASTYDENEERITNARRYFESFSNTPYQTWLVIYNRLLPYFAKMPKKVRVYYEKTINEITGQFSREDFKNNKKLEPEFLHAYSSQLNEIYRKKKEN